MEVDKQARATLLVFGGSGTLGRALVEAGSKHFSVAACGFKHEPPGEERFQFDVLNGPELAALPDKLAKRNLRVSAVVNCIGATRDRMLANTSESDWEEVVDLNLRSAFLIARAFLPVFVSQREGHFIFVGSHAGLLGRAGQASYAAAKAGLIALAQTIAREYGRRKIQANVVLPGYLSDSPMVKRMPEEARQRIAGENALGGPSHPSEVAGFILHLLEMKSVSGQVFALDSRILHHL